MLTNRNRRSFRLQPSEHVAAESGQAVTEYAVVLAVLLIAAGAIVLTLQGSIESFIAEVGGKIGTILS
jgi:Flp pilus assembly pilin Flp